MTDTWPREGDATVAVDAAARKAFENMMAERAKAYPEGVVMPTWDDLDATDKLKVREGVLDIVWAALSALPDPRHMTWLEGLYCGLRQGYEDDNPYPNGSV